MRNSPRDIAEAGRELGRFDSRPWLPGVTPDVAVLVTTRDELVPPSASGSSPPRRAGPCSRRRSATWRSRPTGDVYNPQLLAAIASVAPARDAAAA